MTGPTSGPGPWKLRDRFRAARRASWDALDISVLCTIVFGLGVFAGWLMWGN